MLWVRRFPSPSESPERGPRQDGSLRAGRHPSPLCYRTNEPLRQMRDSRLTPATYALITKEDMCLGVFLVLEDAAKRNGSHGNPLRNHGCSERPPTEAGPNAHPPCGNDIAALIPRQRQQGQRLRSVPRRQICNADLERPQASAKYRPHHMVNTQQPKSCFS